MEVWHGVDAVKRKGGILTLGFFDGVHLGHRLLIDDVRQLAAAKGCPAIGVTMWPHPRIVLGSDPGRFQLINSLEQKLDLLSLAGLDAVLILEFTLELARMLPYEFLDQVLYSPLAPAGIVMGYDHRFGHMGAGDYPLLQQFGSEKGIMTSQSRALLVEGDEVSSTMVRRAIEAGDLGRASHLLGRDFCIRGRVVPGKQIGRKLGYPTANIAPSSRWQLLPAYGVYEGYVQLPEGEGGRRLRAVINVGTRPTVDCSGETSIEAFILDFQGNLYGDELPVYFVRKIRDELRFSSLEALSAQIAQDVAQIQMQGEL